MNATSAVALLASLVLAMPGSGRAAIVVEGTDRSTLLPPAGLSFSPYRNDGYRLELDGDAVRVEVRIGPLGSTAPLPRWNGPAVGATARLARGLTSGATTEYEAVTRVLAWISRQIRYELDRGRSQEPEAVLARRSAYCTGVARLAVAMLRDLGLEAREVAGYVLSDTGAGGELHRWIEVFYPDRGWVFSDPLRSHHFVPSNYLRLAGDEVDPAATAGGLVLSTERGLSAVDLLSAAPTEVRIRRNDGRQRHASLRVEVEGSRSRTEVVLAGAGLRRAQSVDGAGAATFLGLAPGEYRLDWTDGQRIVASRQLRFRAPVRAEVRLVGREPGAAREAGRR